MNLPISSSPSRSRRSFLVSDVIAINSYQLLVTFWGLLLVVVSVVVPPVVLVAPDLFVFDLPLRWCLNRLVLGLFSCPVVVLVKSTPFRDVLGIATILVVIQLFRRLLLLLAVAALSLAIFGLRFRASSVVL